MRFKTLICASIGYLLATTPTYAKSEPEAKNQHPYQSTKAANGMEVISIPMPKVPLATLVLVAKAGAMTELKTSNGLTHLWEHMFFKGNKRLPDQEAFNKRIRQLGISYNGDTSSEMVRYYFTLPSKNLDAGLQFMADAISTPLLDPKELERERKVVLDEYDRNASQPGFEMSNIHRMHVFGDMEYLRNALGRRSIIEHATVEQLIQIKNDVFVPNNCALVVSGDVDPTTLMPMIEKHFKHWTTPKDWKPIDKGPFPPFPATTEIASTHEQAQNVIQQIVWNGPRTGVEKEDTWVADVLITLLGHRSGKFYKKYIDSGLTLSADFGYHTQRLAGELSLAATSSPENALKAKALLLKEPSEWLKPGYFTETQLEDTRRKLKIGYKMDLNKPSEFGKTLAFWWAIAGLDYHQNYLPNMTKVTIKDIQTFVKKYLINKPYLTLTLLNPKDTATAKIKDNSGPYKEKYLKNY